MTSRGLEIRVGAIVVLGALIAVIGTMWFQKFQLAEKRYAFYVRFDEVGGLSSGDPIQVNGVDQGRVNAVELLQRVAGADDNRRIALHDPHEAFAHDADALQGDA